MSNDFLRWLDQGRGVTSSPSRGNLSYADPKFGKRKKSNDGGQFDWQGKLLKDLPNSMGRSYEDKFNTLANQIGVPKEQVNAFKTFIDAQEYGAKTHSQHVQDHDIKQAKRDGEGARTILREREQREKQAEAERLAKLAKQEDLQKTIKGWQGLPGMNVGVQGTGRSNRAMDALTQPKKEGPKIFQDIKKALTGENHRIEPTKQSNLHFGDDDSRTTLRPPENVERFGGRAINSALLGLPEQTLKRRLQENPNDEELQAEFDRIYGGEMAWHDYVADILGYLPPGMGGVKAARAVGLGAKGLTKGVTKHNVKQLAKEGAVVGGGIELGNVAVKEALNPDDQDWLDNLLQVGIGVGAGALLDPTLFMAGPLGRKIAENMAEGALSKTFKKQVEDAIKFNSHTTLNPQRPILGGPDPRSGLTEGLSQGQVKFSNNNPIDDMLGPKGTQALEQPQVKSDPYGEGHFDDSDIDAMIAKRQNAKSPEEEVAATLAEAHFPDVPKQKVNYDEVEVFANPVKPKDKTESGWARFKRHVVSDLSEADKIERVLSKNLPEELSHMLTHRGKGQGLEEAFSFHKNSRMLQSSISRGAKSAETSYGAIAQQVEKLGLSVDDFDKYLLAKHSDDNFRYNMDKVARRVEAVEKLDNLADPNSPEGLRLQKEIKELEPYKMHENVSEEWVAHTLAKYENRPDVQKLQREFVEEQLNDLDMLEQNGILSSEAVASMKERHPNYVSMVRDVGEAETLGLHLGKKVSSARNPIKSRKHGSEDKSFSPLAMAYINRITSVVQSERANAVNKLGKLIEIEGAEQFFAKADVNSPRFDPSKTLKGWENGQEVHYEVPPSILDAYNNLDAGPADFFGKTIVKGLADLRKQTTTHLNVKFHLFSAVRDTPHAILVSRTGAHIGHHMLGFADSFLGKNLEKLSGGVFKSYRDASEREGVAMATFIARDKYSTDKINKALADGEVKGVGKVLNPLELIRNFGMKMEQGPRLGEMRSAKGKGYSDRAAAFEAIDVIDYGKSGKTVRKTNPYVPYLNPTVQGNARLLQALQEDPVNFVTKGALYFGVPTISLYASRFADTTTDAQRDKIFNQSDWVKDSMWSIPDPTPGSDEVFLYPKAYGLGQMFANPIERALDAAYDHTNKDAGELLKDTVMDNLRNLAIPYDVAGLVLGLEVLSNTDFFTGYDIEDMSMRNKPIEERYDANTSTIARMLGKGTSKAGLSPEKLDHIIKKSTGTIGRDALDASDNVLSELMDDVPAKTRTNAQILDPLARFKFNETSATGTYGGILDQAEKDDNKQKEELDWLKSMGIKSTTKMETPAQQMYAANKELNDQIKEVRESKTLTAKEKQKQIARLRAEQRKIGTKFITE